MRHRRIIKRGPVVVASQEDGSMDPSSPSSQGLFLADTRYLSLFRVRLNNLDPILMGSTEEIKFQSDFIFTNPDLKDIPAHSLGILQRNTIEADGVHIVFTLANWSLEHARFTLSVEADSDFFDSFEARGVKRTKRGELKAPAASDGCLVLQYTGLDKVTRTTRIASEPAMDHFENRTMYFPVELTAGKRETIDLTITMRQAAPEGVSLEPEPHVTRNPTPDWWCDRAHITTSNATVNAVLERGLNDLEVLMLEFHDAWVPAAGLPRFAVPFGRDSLVTGLQTLILNPTLSRDVLRFLAHRQGKEVNEWNYEQPGKIMHEMHTGELARLNYIPFGHFYGSVDSTVYFLVLGAEYIRWTHDMDLYHELKDNFDAAWDWVWKYGDMQGKGYVQYKAHTPPRMSSAALTVGLFNQGWKDSANAVTYRDGKIVTDHPVALAEVQGDLYRALHTWGEVFSAMPESEGCAERGKEMFAKARDLKKRYNHDFWMDDRKYYAMGLDGHGRHIDSITSNPLECLWARLVDEEHVEETLKIAMSDEMMTMWGLRTMASTEAAYNPFSYHDGSIWPFENSFICAGLKKYGRVEETQRVFDAMLEASLSFEYRRWPEVYAGVSEKIGGVLARQPDASRPQAWSAGAPFLLLQTLLGVATQPFTNRVDITPALPSCIDEIEVANLRIAGGTIGLRVRREGNGVAMQITDNPDGLEVIIHPATGDPHRLKGEDMPAVSR